MVVQFLTSYSHKRSLSYLMLSHEIFYRGLSLLLVVYLGVMFSLILVYKVYQEVTEFQTRIVITLQLIQHFVLYIFLYLFNDDIKFLHDYAALAYISVILLASLITTKMIVCTMAKMNFAIIHLEFLLFVPFFYLQSQYDGTKESEDTLKLIFFITLGVITALYFKFVHCCISQLTDFLGIYCFTLGPRKVKET
mmetsp:Transcript_2464/g.2116  ORF Transcript_2464/g.2116 Transcript_2464/m.2116 type:complete len:194 (+) Transcript_2464:230-811(+)